MTKTQRFPPRVAGDFVRRSERERVSKGEREREWTETCAGVREKGATERQIRRWPKNSLERERERENSGREFRFSAFLNLVKDIISLFLKKKIKKKKHK